MKSQEPGSWLVLSVLFLAGLVVAAVVLLNPPPKPVFVPSVSYCGASDVTFFFPCGDRYKYGET